jgi:hypothetical protein
MTTLTIDILTAPKNIYIFALTGTLLLLLYCYIIFSISSEKIYINSKVEIKLKRGCLLLYHGDGNVFKLVEKDYKKLSKKLPPRKRRRINSPHFLFCMSFYSNL